MSKRGSIYRQPGCATFMIQYYRNGKRVREAVGSDDYRAAQQRLTQRLAQCDRGEAIDIARKSVTIAELWEGLQRHYRINGRKSAECLGRRWKHLEAFFANMQACHVTYDCLEGYVDQRLTEQAANATINRELSALKTAFRLGRKKQTVRQIPDFPHLAERTTPGADSLKTRSMQRSRRTARSCGCVYSSKLGTRSRGARAKS